MSITHPVTCRSKNPHVRKLFARLNQTEITVQQLAEQIPISSYTIHSWAAGRYAPSITNLEAAFNVLGYTLIDRPMEPKDGK